MSQYRERAMELFKQGYNCSQAVVAAFCEDTGMDFENALKISSSFGGGMGRLREELLGQKGKGEGHAPEERTEEYYKKRPCVELVGDAAEIMHQIIRQENSNK